MYNEKVLISKPALDSIGMNTSNWILKIICVDSPHDLLLKCCSVTFVVGTNVKKHCSGFPKVMSFKKLNNNKHKIDT